MVEFKLLNQATQYADRLKQISNSFSTDLKRISDLQICKEAFSKICQNHQTFIDELALETQSNALHVAMKSSGRTDASVINRQFGKMFFYLDKLIQKGQEKPEFQKTMFQGLAHFRTELLDQFKVLVDKLPGNLRMSLSAALQASGLAKSSESFRTIFNIKEASATEPSMKMLTREKFREFDELLSKLKSSKKPEQYYDENRNKIHESFQKLSDFLTENKDDAKLQELFLQVSTNFEEPISILKDVFRSLDKLTEKNTKFKEAMLSYRESLLDKLLKLDENRKPSPYVSVEKGLREALAVVKNKRRNIPLYQKFFSVDTSSAYSEE